MTNRQAAFSVAFLLAFVIAVGWHTDRAMKKHTITITEQDIVRYCLDGRRAKLGAKDIEYYCHELGGDEYMAKGFKPNYDKYPSYKMFPAPTESSKP